jgi:hypothetical protein
MPDIDALKAAAQAKAQNYVRLTGQTNDAKTLGPAKQDMMDAQDALEKAIMQQKQAPPATQTQPAQPATSPWSWFTSPQPIQRKRGGPVRSKTFRW